MIDPEIKSFIQREIQRSLMLILSGQAGVNTVTTETIESPGYPGSNSLEERPVMHPFGFVSRAPQGIISVIGRQGSDPGNYLVMGHRDPGRPEVEEGAAAMYASEKGPMMMTGAKGVFVGKGGTADKPLLLGTEGGAFLGQLLDLIIAHVHPSPGAPANNVADFTQLKTQIDEKKLISTTDGGL
jgi:hypothetical protein